MAEPTDIDITGPPSGYELHRLSLCKPVRAWKPDPRTAGHVEIITVGDELAAAVMNRNSTSVVEMIAERYRALRLQATVQARDVAKELGVDLDRLAAEDQRLEKLVRDFGGG